MFVLGILGALGSRVLYMRKNPITYLDMSTICAKKIGCHRIQLATPWRLPKLIYRHRHVAFFVSFIHTMMQSGSLGAEETLKMAQDRDWLVLSVKQDWSKIINSQKA